MMVRDFYPDYVCQADTSKVADKNGRSKNTKIVNIKNHTRYCERLLKITELMSNLSEVINNNLFDIACIKKWEKWSDNQPVGALFEVDEVMLRSTGDKNIDFLWELLDKMEEVNGKIKNTIKAK